MRMNPFEVSIIVNFITSQITSLRKVFKLIEIRQGLIFVAHQTFRSNDTKIQTGSVPVESW